MDLVVGQPFTMRERVQTDPPIPLSIYLDGGCYRVTEENRGFVEKMISDGKADLGDLQQATVASPATVSGTAIVK